MKTMREIVGAGMLAGLTMAEVASANSAGVFDYARQGCGVTVCHSALSNTVQTTQLFLMGLPQDGYVPGCAYPLQVFVFGIAIPAPFTYAPIAGFNLEATGGALSGDSTVQTPGESDCHVLEREESCVAGSSSDPCSRPCTSTPFDIHHVASHVHRFATDYTMTDRFMWSLEWTAPSSGPVKFYLAGNFANGNGTNDIGDLWAVQDPVVVNPTSNPGDTCH